ncbi:MAG: superoxide dismutase [Alphaproteobacteria bacterium]|nr:superoxide dismutase [Alphaproteobacteria bacterium]
MIDMKDLPYDLKALAPTISPETMMYHYEKHYAGYVQKTNELIANTPFENAPLDKIIFESAADIVWAKLYNQAAQVANHEFFWNSLSPKKEDYTISPDLANLIQKDFGSKEKIMEELLNKGLSQFGSGWVWLTLYQDHLCVESTSNADTLLVHPEHKPLLVIDVWEHAYYLDYQNKRTAYLKAVTGKLLNWRFASQQLS